MLRGSARPLAEVRRLCVQHTANCFKDAALPAPVPRSVKGSHVSLHAVGRHKGRWGAQSPTREDSHDELSTSAAHKGSPSADSRVSREPQPSATSHQVRLPVLARCSMTVSSWPYSFAPLVTRYGPAACLCMLHYSAPGRGVNSRLALGRRVTLSVSCSQCSPLCCWPSDLPTHCPLGCGMRAAACRLTWSSPYSGSTGRGPRPCITVHQVKSSPVCPHLRPCMRVLKQLPAG